MILTDAGPLVAIIDRKDADHDLCVAALKTLRGPMLTAWPALVEAMYLLGSRAGFKGQEAILRLVGRGDLVIGELGKKDIDRCRTLMDKYQDLPMDFADAALVTLSEKHRTRRVFTLDTDFRSYRTSGRRHFDITPAL